MYLFETFSTSVLSLAQSLVDSEQEKILYSILENKPGSKEVSPSSLSDKIHQQIKDLLVQIPPEITDEEYIRNVILTSLFLTRTHTGERLLLPVIDDKKLDKEDAVPYFIWGLLYKNWKPTKQEDGLSVFFQGYANRGEYNKRKKIYFSAVTLDLYSAKYQEKVVSFFSEILNKENANKPLMKIYLDKYFDLYWNLHLGVTEEIPSNVKEIGYRFNRALASLKPLEVDFYNDYMEVRNLYENFINWVLHHVTEMSENISKGQITGLDQTFVYYWLKNSNNGQDLNFRKIDVAFECFHNFIALSQWGNTIYNIMSKFIKTDDTQVLNWFNQMMQGNNYDRPDGSAFTPLDRFVMELFRIISPNSGSISTIKETRITSVEGRQSYNITPHQETSEYFIHWADPSEFNPDRYKTAPTSEQMDETKSQEIGFAQCPFHKEDFAVKDGRTDTRITNSIFGTVYSVTNGKSLPVCDYAGYAPFGFGYRRCPGEQLTVEVIKDFLRHVWNNQIQFKKLDITPERVPVGPGTFVNDDIGFLI
jgi:hypothetical protein